MAWCGRLGGKSDNSHSSSSSGGSNGGTPESGIHSAQANRYASAKKYSNDKSKNKNQNQEKAKVKHKEQHIGALVVIHQPNECEQGSRREQKRIAQQRSSSQVSITAAAPSLAAFQWTVGLPAGIVGARRVRLQMYNNKTNKRCVLCAALCV
uniref:Uncharacterized protein n=1 Tax=Bactrocera dorsalis TaxID=27457 RepID=A0A034WTQ5_BACDO